MEISVLLDLGVLIVNGNKTNLIKIHLMQNKLFILDYF